MKMKAIQKTAMAGIAVVMAITTVGTIAQPVQEVHANGVGVYFGKTMKMNSYRTVYLNTSGKKEAVYYKGSTYKVMGTYSRGYYKVYFKGIGYRYMKYQDVLKDRKL